jgi:hypothetical protein
VFIGVARQGFLFIIFFLVLFLFSCSALERSASLLALLPTEFTTADLIKLCARKGQSVKNNAICMVLNRWRNNNKITKINESTWRKIH